MRNSQQLRKLQHFELVEIISDPKTPCHIKQKAIRTLRNIKDRQLAWKIIEKVLPVLETFILHPSNNDLQREALWLLGYVRNYSTIGIIENLIASPQTSPLLKENALRVLGFSISRGSKLAAQAVERLFPILERLITSPQTLDGLKKIAIKTLVKGLPLKVRGPKVEFLKEGYNFVSVNINDILSKVQSPHYPRFISRSLVYDLVNNHILVIKILKEKQHPSSLLREGYWIKYLNKLKTEGHFTDVRFDIPQLLEFSGCYLIKLTNIPIRIPKGIKLHPERYAVCFVVSKEYFCYPNETQPEKVLSGQETKEIMARCAYLLGYLTSLGIIHTEVIPLFHNRIQIGRRFDRGLYKWQFRGRLDRWLVSCDWPNFGKTGIRDFEHIISWDEKPGSQGCSAMYRFIGNHLLSLFLVTGSYFRNRKREMTGWDHKGKPVDARNLFNKSLFKEIVQAILLSYYKGFVGKQYLKEFPFDLDNLIQRAIKEMGIDRHMEERLRIEDQQRMSEEEFKEFLMTKGYSEEEIKRFTKGVKDIILFTGPHLGGFNELISLPEMIDAITIWAALCIIGKYKMVPGAGIEPARGHSLKGF